MDEPTPQPEIKREEYLTMAQAARVSGYQQDYLSQLARLGKLKAIKSGHHWITTRSAIEGFTATHKKATARSAPSTQTQEPKIENKNITAELSTEILSPLPPGPGAIHSMHVPVPEEDLPHAPTIPLNI